MQTTTHEPLLIIGAGPVGLISALALARAGFKVSIFEQKSLEELCQANSRMLALSHASINYLDNLSVDLSHDITWINQVHMSQAGYLATRVKAIEMGLEALGGSINYTKLIQILLAKVQAQDNISLITCNVTRVDSTSEYAVVTYEQDGVERIITSDLAILAEGGALHSTKYSNNFNYKEQILIVTLETLENNNNIAYERFDKNDTFALLPLGDKGYTLIWTLHQTDDIKQLQDPTYVYERLSQLDFMQRFMPFKCTSKITVVPLSLAVAKERVVGRLVLLGNAAQKIHPISAQGLNLAIRDIKVFSKYLSSKRHEINASVLAKYHGMRTKDVNSVVNFTHKLALNLGNTTTVNKLGRGLGIMALNQLPYIKRSLITKLIFGQFN